MEVADKVVFVPSWSTEIMGYIFYTLLDDVDNHGLIHVESKNCDDLARFRYEGNDVLTVYSKLNSVTTEILRKYLYDNRDLMEAEWKRKFRV